MGVVEIYNRVVLAPTGSIENVTFKLIVKNVCVLNVYYI